MNAVKIKSVNLRNFPDVLNADYAFVVTITVVPGETASGYVQLGTMQLQEDVEVFVPYPGFSATVPMTSEQYKEWGKDDIYAVDCILRNYGLTPE